MSQADASEAFVGVRSSYGMHRLKKFSTRQAADEWCLTPANHDVVHYTKLVPVRPKSFKLVDTVKAAWQLKSWDVRWAD